MVNKKKNIFFVIVLFICVISIFSVKKVLFSDKSKDIYDLINISDLSDEFIENYFEDMKELSQESSEKKENILIVISNKKVKNKYDAEKIIEAPNNQYILQFSSKEKKENALKTLENDESISSVEQNEKRRIQGTTYNSWGIKKMFLDYAIDNSDSNNLEDVVVAIIDTGCDLSLFNRYYDGKIAGYYDELERSTTVMKDTNGHGTHVAGTVAEGTPSNVKIFPVKASTDGDLYMTDIITAINYITIDKKADVINMSFGGYVRSAAEEQAIESAKQKNIISVAAAGNDNTSKDSYPASFDNTISIASVDSELNKSSFSNYGSKITFAAPGTNVKSIMDKDTDISKKSGNNSGDDFEIISGTSMATPHAVAAVAILKSYNKDLTLQNTIDLLKIHAKDLGDSGWDQYYGYGFISFENAKFCNGNNCDEYGVFKNDEEGEISKIEASLPLVTSYNYGSIYNILNTNVKIYYTSDNFEIFKLWQLEDAEISQYDPYSDLEQTINVKYKDFEFSFKITNPSSYELGWEYKVINDNSIELTKYKDNRHNIEVLYFPEEIDGYKVVSIADNSNLISKLFNDSIDSLGFKKVILPRTLTKIGSSAFTNMSSLEYVISEAESVEVGDYAFRLSSNLLEFDGLISKLGKSSFYGCKKLDNVRLSDNITLIPDNAFGSCSNLENINIPKKLVSIGSSAFSSNYRLKDIILPEGLKSIGKTAFNAADLEFVNLPDSLEEIGDNAFIYSGIVNVNISKSLVSIGEGAFSRCSSIESIIVDSENPVYDSRDNSNALIETESNTLLKGIYKTVIPKTVTKIGYDAFSFDLNLEEIVIPDSVTEIEGSAFYECNYLTKVVVPKTVISIGSNAFKNYPSQMVGYSYVPITIWTYNDAYAKSYAIDNKIQYQTFDPSYILEDVKTKKYNAFDVVDGDINSIKLYYDYSKLNGTTYKEYKNTQGREEVIVDNYEILYPNDNDSFRYGDTYYKIVGANEFNIGYEKNITVEVDKAIPKYEIPTNLTASIDQKLSEIILPDGFQWMNPDTVIDEKGNIGFKAKYVPSDTINYKTVEDIEIIISVENPRTEIVPNITLENKVYDGETTIDVKNISISNLDSNEFSIVSVSSDSADVGDRKATIKLKLTDDKYKNYSFDNGKQEKEFVVDFKIVPKILAKPTRTPGNYVYNGNEIVFDILNFDSDTMNISGNKGTNVGKYDVVISLKNSNYVWEDETSSDIILSYEIVKANLYIRDNSSDVTVNYDKNPHFVHMSIEYESGTILRYMDENGEYSLENAPKYTAVGTYVIKYKCYLDDNHSEYFGERTLKILPNTITFTSSDYEGVYDGEDHSINIDVDTENSSIKYSINNTNYDLSEIPTFKEIGEYIINYKISAEGYEDIEGSNKVKIYGIKSFCNLVLKNNIIVSSNSSFSHLLNNIDTYSTFEEFIHYDLNKEIATYSNIKTGDTIKININNSKEYEYKIAYLGDVNGNGEIDIIDYVRIMKDIMDISKLSGVEFEAADMNRSNSIDIIDYIRIMKIIMEES